MVCLIMYSIHSNLSLLTTDTTISRPINLSKIIWYKYSTKLNGIPPIFIQYPYRFLCQFWNWSFQYMKHFKCHCLILKISLCYRPLYCYIELVVLVCHRCYGYICFVATSFWLSATKNTLNQLWYHMSHWYVCVLLNNSLFQRNFAQQMRASITRCQHYCIHVLITGIIGPDKNTPKFLFQTWSLHTGQARNRSVVAKYCITVT